MPVPSSVTRARHGDLDLELVAGSWPQDVPGEVVVSAPAPDPALPSALFGFGVLCRLALAPGRHGAAPDRFAWRTATVDTPSRRLHHAVPHRFRAGPTGWSSTLGVPNAANTAPLPWDGRLLATWDVGRPVEVDPLELRFLGEVGHRDSWGAPTLDTGVLPFLFTSAHPVVDPDRRCLWTVKQRFASGGGTELHLVRWSGDGTRVDHWPVQGAVVQGSSHTISQTSRHLVLADSGNFRTDPGELAGGPRTVTIDDDAAVFLLTKEVVDATPPGTPLVPVRSRVAPTTGHFYAAWDDSDGVRVLFEHLDLMDLGYRIEAGDLDALGRPVDPALVGFYNTAMAPSSCSEVRIDPVTGASRVEALVRDDTTWNLELSAMDWSVAGRTAPTLHHVAYQGFRPGAVSRRCLDRYGDRVGPLPGDDTPGRLASLRRGSLEVAGAWEYPDTGDHITSPVFVPRPGGEPGGHDGWVVLPVLSDAGFRVELFDAATVSSGPVAVLAAPGGACVPVLLHAAWLPEAAPAPDAERLRFSDELDAATLDRLDDELAVAVRRVAADLDAGAPMTGRASLAY